MSASEGTAKSSQPLLSLQSNQWRKRPVMSVEEVIGFEIPGPARTLTKEEIAAEYAGRMTRPIPAAYYGKRSVSNRIDGGVRMPFAVFKVYDSGQATFVSQWETWDRAVSEAGKLRDAMTDDECGKDFTFMPRERKRNNARRNVSGKISPRNP